MNDHFFYLDRISSRSGRLHSIGSPLGKSPQDFHEEALAQAHDAAVQMIDTSVVRVHQH
jgi:hypothetical protein